MFRSWAAAEGTTEPGLIASRVLDRYTAHLLEIRVAVQGHLPALVVHGPISGLGIRALLVGLQEQRNAEQAGGGRDTAYRPRRTFPAGHLERALTDVQFHGRLRLPYVLRETKHGRPDCASNCASRHPSTGGSTLA